MTAGTRRSVSADPSTMAEQLEMLKKGVENLKEEVPPSVGLNILMTWNAVGMDGVWQSEEETPCSAAANLCPTVQAFQYLYSNGAQLDWSPEITMRCGFQVMSPLRRLSRFGAADRDEAVEVFSYVLNHPSCHWNVLEDSVLLDVIDSNLPSACAVAVGDDGEKVKSTGLTSSDLAVYFRTYHLPRCNIVDAILDSRDTPLESLRWFLRRPEICQDVFGVAIADCSVLAADHTYNVSNASAVEFMCAEVGAILVPAKASCSHKLGGISELNSVVDTAGAAEFIRTKPLTSHEFRLARARLLWLRSAFVDAGNVDYLSKASVLVISSMLTVHEVLTTFLEGREKYNFGKPHRDCLAYLLRGGYLHPVHDWEKASANLNSLRQSLDQIEQNKQLNDEIRLLADSLIR